MYPILSPCCWTKAWSLGVSSSRQTPTTFNPSFSCFLARSVMCGKTTLQGPHLHAHEVFEPAAHMNVHTCQLFDAHTIRFSSAAKVLANRIFAEVLMLKH